MNAHPPGWYTDPTDQNRARWWDGNDWTDHTRAPEWGETLPRLAPPPTTPPPIPTTRRARYAVGVLLLVVVAIGAYLIGSHHHTNPKLAARADTPTIVTTITTTTVPPTTTTPPPPTTAPPPPTTIALPPTRTIVTVPVIVTVPATQPTNVPTRIVYQYQTPPNSCCNDALTQRSPTLTVTGNWEIDAAYHLIYDGNQPEPICTMQISILTPTGGPTPLNGFTIGPILNTGTMTYPTSGHYTINATADCGNRPDANLQIDLTIKN